MKIDSLICTSKSRILIFGCVFFSVFPLMVPAQTLNLDSLKIKLKDPESLKIVEYIISEKDDITYGWACGIVGTPPPLRDSFDELVRRKEEDALLLILELPEPEKKLYALEALTYLRISSGRFLGGKLNSVKAELLLDSISIQTCEACTYNIETTKEIVLRNTNERISENYKWSDWLYERRYGIESPVKVEPPLLKNYHP